MAPGSGYRGPATSGVSVGERPDNPYTDVPEEPTMNTIPRLGALLVAISLAAAACGTSDADTAVTTTQPPAAAQEATTTTTIAPATQVLETPVTGLLGVPDSNLYGGTSELPDPGSVEANWYQWEGFYVVLYRGYKAGGPGQICPGNSALGSTGFTEFSNSPVPTDDPDNAICEGAVIAPLDAGARECGDLLYYITRIQVERDEDVTLYASLERENSFAEVGFDGQTSQAPSDIANTPEFEPNLTAYSLPATEVDEAHTVTC